MPSKDSIAIPKSSVKWIALIFVAFAVGYLVGGSFTIIPKGTTAPVQPSAPSAPSQPSQPSVAKFDVPSYVPFKGSSSAKISFIEFGDYQCPFCERFFTQAETQIVKDYVDTGKVKFYFLDFQFLGPDSQTLGQGAWCANDQGKYYDFHDYIYSHPGQENSGWATADKVKILAANIKGLDAQKFNSCLDSNKHVSRVQELTQLGQTNGVSGTPSFFVGTSDKGYSNVVGAQPYATFKQIFDAQLA